MHATASGQSQRHTNMLTCMTGQVIQQAQHKKTAANAISGHHHVLSFDW